MIVVFLMKTFLSLLLVFLATVSLHAESYDWTYSGSLNSGSGTLDATATGTNGAYLVSDLAGEFNSLSIVSLAPPDTIAGNDNLVFPGQVPLIDFDGLAFTTSLGQSWNLFYSAGTYQSADPNNVNAGDLGTFTLTLVPEPSAFALVALAVFALLITRVVRKAGLKKHLLT